MLGGRGHQTHADEGHPRVTLAALGTLRSGSQPVYLPPLLLLPGDKGEVAKLAVVWLGEDEAGGEGGDSGCLLPPSRVPASSPEISGFPLPRAFGKGPRNPSQGDKGGGQGNSHPRAGTSPARERTRWWTLTAAPR